MSRPGIRQWRPGPEPDPGPGLAALLTLVARGDPRAFELVDGELPGTVYGVVRQVLRDPAQSEEVAQEVLLEIWRMASRCDPARGTPAAWALTIAHRRAVDRVRSAAACSLREQKAAPETTADDDDVAEVVAASLDHQRVRRCLDGLTDLQRESIKLAYYGGYTHPQEGHLLGGAPGTENPKNKDGLQRVPAYLAVKWGNAHVTAGPRAPGASPSRGSRTPQERSS